MNTTSRSMPDSQATVSTEAPVLPTQSESLDWIGWTSEIGGRTAEVERPRGSRNALANARALIESEEEERRLHEPEADAWRAVWRGLVLAQDLETFEALLRGECVPVEKLNSEWIRRFGRRTP